MFLHWTVFVLLLLLPQLINTQELSEKKQLAITDNSCFKPKESEDGKGTVLCIRLEFCKSKMSKFDNSNQ
ncbi:hypothetical protein PRIPAC_92757 [Pristionchus pacificus]|uniref:Uncharacterized protein n=1 Tax=Pristionchus pacificus TaxID=54126 RepID=A0A2A6BPP7_PRIPA|nr:hypothetical protein PRIPAC_92757 [Pristionchus pacificus]|eukprot:PDM67922.1 hypothetical protein PRIPAC_45966 [Pristionchus pacificus]